MRSRTLPASALPPLAGAALGACALLLVATVVLQILMALELGHSVGVTSEGELGVLPSSAAFFAFPLVGFLIARHRPLHPIGWLLLGIGLCWGLRGFFFDSYLPWTLTVHPGSLPASPFVGGLASPLWVPAVGLMGTFLMLLFPDGRLPSTRWRPAAWVSAVTIVGLYISAVVRPGPVEQAPVSDLRNAFSINALVPVQPALDALVMLLPLSILACALAVVVRFRRSRGLERLQLKWLAAAGACVASGYLVLMVASAYAALVRAGPAPALINVTSSAVVLSFVLIPVAIGVAVLRHGLYEIDRLISRTVSYAAVTGLLIATYVGLVTAVSRLTPTGNSLAVAASTLAVAALFQPLRRRVQAAVDRRFNRSRYDAARTVEAFSLQLREQVDLDALAADLLAVVHRTVQPVTVSLWLRGGGGAAP